MRKIKQALILAGGDSTRFWPLTNKCLLSFNGKPALQHLIEEITSYAENVVVVAQPQFINVIRDWHIQNVSVHLQDQVNQSMAGAVLSVPKLSGETIILNGSDFFDFSVLEKLIEKADNEHSEYLLLGQKVNSYFPGGYLKFSGDRIEEIIEKPGEQNTPSSFVKLTADYFADVTIFTEELRRQNLSKDDAYEQALTVLLKKNISNGFIPYEAGWVMLKYPWHTLAVMNKFLSQLQEYRGSNTKISSTALVSGPVYLGKNVIIGDFAKVVGPCFIDDDTIIGDYSLVRGSHIGKKCLIGGYSEITRSYIADCSSFHRNYVGDSIIGEHVLMGAGSTTANFRFDAGNIKSQVGEMKITTNLNKLGAVIGSHSKIGSMTTLLPGVKIGQSSFVGPTSLVSADVPDNIYYFKGESTPNKNNKL